MNLLRAFEMLWFLKFKWQLMSLASRHSSMTQNRLAEFPRINLTFHFCRIFTFHRFQATEYLFRVQVFHAFGTSHDDNNNYEQQKTCSECDEKKGDNFDSGARLTELQANVQGAGLCLILIAHITTH